MTTDSVLIDCDGHILEPPDLWEQYLDPAYRDRALRIRVDPDDGYEYLEIDSRRAKLFWASDYPHPDHPANYLEELQEMVAPMGETARRGILGENVARAYRLD